MKNIISLDECKSLKGIAILLIILHNLLHWVTPFKENERFFDEGNAVYYMEHFQEAPIVSFFSYFGWMGVSLFVLLTGYGLSIKYGNGIRPAPAKTVTGGGNNWLNSNILQFCKTHYVKLLVLVAIPYLIIILQHSSLHKLIRIIPDLLLVRNYFTYPHSPFGEIYPGPYWYLGMCMELYVFFAFCGKYFTNKYFVAVTLLISIATITLPPQLWIRYSRFHLLGWLPAFYVGFFLAKVKKKHISTALRMGMTVVLFGLYIYTSLSQSFWFISDVVGAICFVVMIPFINNKFFLYIGGISACMFVCHPLIREKWLYFAVDYVNGSLLTISVSLIAYVAVCAVASELYSRLLNYLKRLF